MTVTLQQIAEAAGVSRGTVDRAMNNRGRIDPAVAEKILNIAQEMGYKPNRAGRALAMSRSKSIMLGIVVQAAETPFMEKVLEGIQEAKKNVEQMGAQVVVKTIRGLSAEKTIKAMNELKAAGCRGIAIVPVDDEKLKETIDGFTDEGIAIVTFNSDIECSKRLCFVGANATQSGKTAAGLMAEIIPDDGTVLVISGYPSNYAHKHRTNGFCQELAACRDDIRILDVQYAFDNNEMARMITQGMLGEYRDLAGIYLSASGVEGVCQALEEEGLSETVKVISNDLTDQNIRYLQEGKIRFLLGQESYRQGYDPMILLFENLLDGKEFQEEFIYTKIEIKTKYNL